MVIFSKTTPLITKSKLFSTTPPRTISIGVMYNGLFWPIKFLKVIAEKTFWFKFEENGKNATSDAQKITYKSFQKKISKRKKR